MADLMVSGREVTTCPMNSRNPFSRRDIITGTAAAGSLLAVGAGSAIGQSMGDKLTVLAKPETLHNPRGYSHSATVRAGDLVFIAGQVAFDQSGTLIGPGNFRLQLEQVFRNIDAAVRSAGGSFKDVVKLNYYCVEGVPPAELAAVAPVRDSHVNVETPPISTFVFVSRLVRPDWLIEVEAVAVIPEAAA